MGASIQSQGPFPELVQPPGEPGGGQLEISAPGKQWDETVAAHQDATVFHSSAWGRLIEHTYGHRLCYGEYRASNKAAALVPLAEVRSWLTGVRGVSIPFADACEALVIQPQTGLFDALCEYGRSRRWKYFELRGSALLPRDAETSAEFAVHILDLSCGFAEVEKRFEPATRRSLRKAKSSELSVEISTSLDAVHAYYRLHCSTRRRHGAPPQPWRFFQNLHEFLLVTGQGFVVLARAGGAPVAGAVFLHTGRHAVFKFGAAEIAFQNMRPSNFVMGAAIRHLGEKGMASLHFGRTCLSNHGLRRFKSGWGAVESKVSYKRYDLRANRWVTRRDRIGTSRYPARLLRLLPVTANRFLGALLYPHLD